jgi:hypothetical protein
MVGVSFGWCWWYFSLKDEMASQVLPGSSIPSNLIAIIIIIVTTKTTDHGSPSREIVLNRLISSVRSSIRMAVVAAGIGYCWKSSARLRLAVLPLAMMTLALLTKILVTPSCTFLAMSKTRYSSWAWVVRPTKTTRVGDGTTTITRIGSFYVFDSDYGRRMD